MPSFRQPAPKAIKLLTKTGTKNSEIYRGIMQLLSLFGYASIEEIKYRFGLTEREAINRLWYLTKRTGLLKQFPSDTMPQQFYCLSLQGRELVKQFGITDFASNFVPSKYNLMYQRHHRLIIRVWSALKEAWGDKLTEWVTEEHLKKEQTSKGSRVLDAEFFMTVQDNRYVEGAMGKELNREDVNMRCGLEVETSLKSPRRYRKQVEDLSRYLARCSSAKRTYGRILYICGTDTIRDRLDQHHAKKNFGDTKILFIGLEDLLSRKGEAELKALQVEGSKPVKDIIYKGLSKAELEKNVYKV